MRILILGHGKTGKLVADIAHERGHGVHVLDAKENRDAAALTAPFVAGFDVVIDFTTPDAVVQNMRACLATGAKMVIGTTGWYDKLSDMRGLAERKGAGLMYGTNYSIGVQVMLELAEKMGAALKGAGYNYTISETHHAGKLDAPSGTAITLGEIVEEASDIEEIRIESKREGDVMGVHVLEARSASDRLVLTHESFSRRGFAEGAVRAAEWLSTRTGCFDFHEVYTQF
ncbi:4-hydroxy-tetrahydrodipicolinate reductase [Granulicella aggregans]|jgi:4-hydroxy-tetrahydrodipicolinate reductase|uniref:4-hydroxy-tetrahydrodipicolinate reductase n=1 Tax=Granulicella aggregans TaxID=474949 RepID=A0A7W7ZAL3_9BACT|nr:dihydrodipicolinate reductase C-terminal domain-containing protein [Granulicella aggregans]MBB5056217.1 4-hydroxy-tetrahydrodipicolinate reductase [Granulicella aggregans]